MIAFAVLPLPGTEPEESEVLCSKTCSASVVVVLTKEVMLAEVMRAEVMRAEEIVMHTD